MNDLDRFWSMVDKSGACWIWEGPCQGNNQAYGRFLVDGKYRPAHRWIYEREHGPISDDLVMDHLCRTTRCVRTDHLEPVTSKVNILRGFAPPAMNARKTHCVRGHPFSGDNLRIHTRGYRQCRACQRIHRKRWKAAVSERLLAAEAGEGE